MQEKYTKEEYGKLLAKGRRFLLDYLEEICDEYDFGESKNKKDMLLKVMSDEYKRLMREDEKYFRAFERFCSKRRFKREKEAFLRRVVSRMVKVGNVRSECERRDPGYAEYRKTIQLEKSALRQETK